MIRAPVSAEDRSSYGGRGHAGFAATRAHMRAFDFDALDVPFDVQGRLALAPEARGPSQFHRRAFARWTTPRVWLDVFTVADASFHIGDADHVLNPLVSEREVDWGVSANPTVHDLSLIHI